MSSATLQLLKSILHNIGVLLVGYVVAFLGTRVDALFKITRFHSVFTTMVGFVFLTVGFFLRTWAAFHFYMHNMKVISLKPQSTLITTGPYRISRNPLYLGGNVFIFFGAALHLGSPSTLVLTALHLPLIDRFIQREEKQLEQIFGEQWIKYKREVRRWI